MQEFQLKVVSLDNNNFALELYQCAYKKAGEKKRPPAKRLGKVSGTSLVLIKEAIYQNLKANNYDPKTLSYNRTTPYVLSEESGINLAILFLCIQPLRKEEKIINIRDGVMEMSNEEAHYWFAKISNGKKKVALKAMRVLLGEE